MTNLIQYADGRLFATGAAQYWVGQPGEAGAGRMLMEVSIENQRTTAAVDTGGFYFVCDPQLARELKSRLTDPLGDENPRVRLGVRGIEFWGVLYRLTVTLHAFEGNDLPVDATVFVPRLRPDQVWPLPSIIGFQGMLDRIRFAVDPDESLFCFGGLGEI